MKPQTTPASPLNFSRYEVGPNKRLTRRWKILCEMECIVPWEKLHAVIAPKYPISGRVGRQPIGLERMLRMYLLQQWFVLSDEALEDALYDSQSMREFVGINLSRETVPDSTTLLKFKHLLERHDSRRTCLNVSTPTFENTSYYCAKGR